MMAAQTTNINVDVSARSEQKDQANLLWLELRELSPKLRRIARKERVSKMELVDRWFKIARTRPPCRLLAPRNARRMGYS